MPHANHYVIIMAGGIGSRFWPMSRSNFPKQFHDILGRGQSLIQETYNRFATFIPESNIYVVTNESYGQLVQQQLPNLSQDQILLEPVGRNTAPCIAYACYKIKKINPDAVMVVAPADHLIAFEDIFRQNIITGLEACKKENIIMTLGIRPTRPDTGYGYIQYLDPQSHKPFYKVKTFTEKPNLEVAKSFLASGDFVWNSGIFLFSVNTIGSSFNEFLPDMAELFDQLTDKYYSTEEQQSVNAAYITCRNVSIDYGIMEKAKNVFVIPSDFGWSDLGTWGSVYENSEKDEHGNAAHVYKLLSYKSGNNVVAATNNQKVVVIRGLEDFIVVDTENALLICPKKDEQAIREIVADLKNDFGEAYV